ncbi:MAG: hypothetical protein QOE22_117 [Candidatus Parcubacteria bacterium]|jgi:hypothetical protein|nr:hypothetical protein [Candidatus Parcubacteria bacterium]
MKLVQRLLLDLEGIELREPTEPVGAREVVIRELPEPLRPLWSFIDQMMDAHRRLHDQLGFLEGPEGHSDPADMIEHHELHAAIEYAQKLLSIRLQLELGNIDGDDFEGLSVRHGWIIVGVPVRHSPLRFTLAGGEGFAEFLGMLRSR